MRTYSINKNLGVSIPTVSLYPIKGDYSSRMKSNNDIWRTWGQRFRNARKEKGLSLRSCALKMELTEGALRHWENGNRNINLEDFFRLCEIADVDPCLILFGAPMLSPEMRESLNELGEVSRKLFLADPLSNPNYGSMMRRLKKAQRQ